MKMMTISHHQTCKALHPLGRPGVAEEVATAIAFLASKVMMMVFFLYNDDTVRSIIELWPFLGDPISRWFTFKVILVTKHFLTCEGKSWRAPQSNGSQIHTSPSSSMFPGCFFHYRTNHSSWWRSLGRNSLRNCQLISQKFGEKNLVSCDNVTWGLDNDK